MSTIECIVGKSGNFCVTKRIRKTLRITDLERSVGELCTKLPQSHDSGFPSS